MVNINSDVLYLYDMFVFLVHVSNYDSIPSSPDTEHANPEQEAKKLNEDLDISKMKMKEIKAELKKYDISFADCFDRDSLTKRLLESRSRIGTTDVRSEISENVTGLDSEASGKEVKKDNPSLREKARSPINSSYDRESSLKELRKLRVTELRSQLASHKIRWANMFEKEELVIALSNALEKIARFSPSGMLAPGRVTEINGEALSIELLDDTNNDSSSYTELPPLLLDVYATWCGPCQMMAPELDKAAIELGDSIRIAKMDSDKNGHWASKLKVGGLPTLILFDGNGKEVDRIEGALGKEDLIAFTKKII